MLKVHFNGFLVDMDYLHKPKDRHTYNYRRLVPADLRKHYTGREIIKSLKTKDESEALRNCAKVNKQVEVEFARLRSGLPKEEAPTKHSLGLALLERFGIHPEKVQKQSPDTDEGDLFSAHLEETFERVLSAEEMDAVRWNASLADASKLPLAELAALDILRGRFSLNASEYPAQFLRLKGREDDDKFKKDSELAVKFLLAVLPDKPPNTYRRRELNELISYHAEQGLSTGSIQKRLGMLRSMFNFVARELELDDALNHPFKEWSIPKYGEDVIDRIDFSFDQLTVLRNAKDSKVPEIVWLIHLMLDTGLRINECCGIRSEDVFLDDQLPYLRVHRNPFRRLKNKQSHRYIPLVGRSFSAMVEAKAKVSGEWLFDRYINYNKRTTKNTSAANAVNKRLRSILGEDTPTGHSFRHVMQTRLREVGCPDHIRDELGGWSKSVSQSYGSTADLQNKTKFLSESIYVRYRVM